ncbi:MAG: Gfo/Idh/MocA family oxidoreductase [Chloroflexota bacterium]|nr:MAG: Gfo/Idh/MocA family oxidoreductase [Chloroflexota bacterium]
MTSAATVLRVGVVGCGQISQFMHLPYLKRHAFLEIAAMCDLSPSLVGAVADHYGVERRFTDYRRMLELSDVDAVFVATRDHAQVSIDSANAGKHVMSEKPIAFNLEDADRVVAAAKANRVKLMIAYMKRYDPGFEYAVPLFKAMKGLRLIRIHDFGGAFAINDGIFDLMRGADDIPAAVVAAEREKMQADLVQAIGRERAHFAQTYSSLLHLCTHDATILRGAFGNPSGIEYADIYSGGHTIAVLKYGEETRCVWESGLQRDKVPWDESLTAYGAEQTVRVDFPFPYLHNAATTVHVSEKQDGVFVDRTVTASFDEAFRREWRHFYDCIVEDREPLTSGDDARADVQMLVDVVRAVRV